MWAVQPRFEADILSFLDASLELGFGAIEVNHSMDLPQTSALLARARERGVEVTSVHAPAPWGRIDDGPLAGRENRTLNLSSLDEGERRLAVAEHARSIEVAGAAGVRAVVVHLGSVGDLDVRLPDEVWLRAAYLERPSEVGGEEWQSRVASTRASREREAGMWLVSARRSLRDLASVAAASEVTLGLECRLWFNEVPTPMECLELLSEHAPEVAGYWHDVGHAEVLARLGLVPLEAWRDLLSSRLVGVHVHDVVGLTDHRAPGSGSVDFEALGSLLPSHGLRTFEVDQREPALSLRAALDLTRSSGVVG
jgi:sugar phosphate isomerase/epimerase